MRFDEVATDHHTGTLDIGARFCTDELRDLPYHERLGLRFFRPQHHRFRADGHACFSFAHALRFLPRQQQLHIELG